MALSTPDPREHLHTRRVVVEGYRRHDGDWDIEAWLHDSKTYGYEEVERGQRAPGAPVHHMAVRLTMDSHKVIKRVEVAMPAAPYSACQTAQPNYQLLVGKQIGAGWRGAVNEAVGSTRGCTHLRELLFPMATVAFQTINVWQMQNADAATLEAIKNQRPFSLDGCKAWASDSRMVMKFYPQFAAAGCDPKS